ncbi:MAG: DEAD/DEAH box helicase [Candidatus Nanohaloarchaea archaeon]
MHSVRYRGLNPPQEKAVKGGLMDGEDMIVASPTASGKTFIGELAMVNQVVQNDKAAVYIVPLKALAPVIFLVGLISVFFFPRGFVEVIGFAEGFVCFQNSVISGRDMSEFLPF